MPSAPVNDEFLVEKLYPNGNRNYEFLDLMKVMHAIGPAYIEHPESEHIMGVSDATDTVEHHPAIILGRSPTPMILSRRMAAALAEKLDHYAKTGTL